MVSVKHKYHFLEVSVCVCAFSEDRDTFKSQKYRKERRAMLKAHAGPDHSPSRSMCVHTQTHSALLPTVPPLTVHTTYASLFASLEPPRHTSFSRLWQLTVLCALKTPSVETDGGSLTFFSV